MASNITNAASFATANMKPSPGEQADALWAQKLADNTGYLYYLHRPGPTVDGYSGFITSGLGGPAGTYDGTKFFRKENLYGTIYGSYVAKFTRVGMGMEIFVDGVSVVSRNSSGAETLTGSFATSIAAKSDGNTYEFVGVLKHGTFFGNQASLNVTSWFKA